MAPKKPPKVTEPEAVDVGPPLQQDIHFVLKLAARVREPPPSPAEEEGQQHRDVAAHASSSVQEPGSNAATTGTAADGVPGTAGASPQYTDPSSMELTANFTPWVGEAMAPAPVKFPNQAGAGGATALEGVQRVFSIEQHFKLPVDEAFVRVMASGQGVLALAVRLGAPLVPELANKSKPKPKPKGKGATAEEAPPTPPPVSFTGTFALDCSGMLVGDTSASGSWPSKRTPMPGNLGVMFESVEISLQALSILAPEEPIDAAGGKGGKGKPAKAPAKGSPEEDLSTLPGEPVAILTEELKHRLNPIVITPLKAKGMPDAPATRHLLDSRCHPVKLRVAWPPNTVPREQTGFVGPWKLGADTDPEADPVCSKVHVRDITFGEADVLLAADYSLEDMLRWCKEDPLVIEVHDRDAIPEPPAFPIAVDAGDSTADDVDEEDEDGFVCGVACLPLLDLAKGYTCVRCRPNVLPLTTVRGAASLDWNKRPGNYCQVNSTLKVIVRTAVPLSATRGPAPAEKLWARATFVFDYRDSDLFHTLEDTVRRHNAWRLGLAAPADPPPQSADPLLSTGSDPGSTDRAQTGLGRAAGLSASGAAPSPGPGSPGRGSPGPFSTGAVSTGMESLKSARGRTKGAADGPLTQRQATHVSRTSSRSRSGGGNAGGGTGGRRVSPERPEALSTTRAARTPRTERSPSRAVVSTKGGKSLRFDNPDSDNNDEDEEELPSLADMQLRQALEEIERINLDMQILAGLSTCKLTDAQAADTSLDLLTGFHLADAKERMVVVEGAAGGAGMAAVWAISQWAQSEPPYEATWRRRSVVYNRSICYSTRMWQQLGVDLYIVKLRAPLPKLLAEAGSYATGKVRVDCMQGLRRLGQLRSVQWGRLAADLTMYPSPHMIRLVDKKFGGELTKADVLGVEVDEYNSDEEDGGEMHLNGHDADAASFRSSRSSRSHRSRRSAKSRRTNPKRSRPPLVSLEMSNEAYLSFREEARQRRLATNFLSRNMEHVLQLEAAGESIRSAWREWNPQREAARALEAAVKSGAMTLQETIDARTQAENNFEPLPGSIPPEDSLRRGWYPHGSTFKWPAPRDPGTFNQVHNKPTQYRVEQLTEPWVEGEQFSPLALRGHDPSLQLFDVNVKNAAGTFEHDTNFFKTVFTSGAGRAKEEADIKAAEKAAWAAKVVGKTPVMHVTIPSRGDLPAQTDRVKHLLVDPPAKKGFKLAHVPPAPYSMYKGDPYVSAHAATITRDARFDPAASMGASDFVHVVAKNKSQTTRKGQSQAYTAALHDPYYPKED